MKARLAGGLLLALLTVTAGCSSSSGRSASSPASTPAPSTSAPIPAVVPQQQHLDAHDGGIIQVDSTFHLYGTANGCGYVWMKPGTPYCGVAIYSSTDLRSWTYSGLAFDPKSGDWQAKCTPGGCFRPHVVFNPHTRRYVMWLQNFTEAGFRDGYRVLTSPAPLGPWELTEGGRVPSPSGDETIFADDDGVGYVVRTDLAGKVLTNKSHELEIVRLDSTYIHVVGTVYRPPVGFVEAPILFKRADTYYLAYSDPACPYCQGTGTSVMSAKSLSGPWSAPYSITPKSCGGQPTKISPLTVNGEQVYLYQSDQWVNTTPGKITGNQTAAPQAWSPLTFTPEGRINPVRCPSGSPAP